MGGGENDGAEMEKCEGDGVGTFEVETVEFNKFKELLQLNWSKGFPPLRQVELGQLASHH